MPGGFDKDRFGHRFLARRYRIFLPPATEGTRKTEIEFSESIQTRVLGPHCGKRLAHVTDRVFCCSRNDRLPFGCEATIAPALGEEEQVRDGIAGLTEVGGKTKVATESPPDAPCSLGVFGALLALAGADECGLSMEITAELSGFVGWQSRHEIL